MRKPAGMCVLALLLIAALAAPAAAQNLAEFEKRVTVKKLDNGLTVLILERPEAPVFSYFTHVDVGGAQEVPGITGIAHMFEHMAFKGTDRIGTSDYEAEAKALERVEKTYAALEAARRRGADKATVEKLEKDWQAAVDAAGKYVVDEEFSRIVDRNGGVGLNASTNSDETSYYFSIPSNRLELWAYLESERFLKPVMREFYKERDVVQEERRMRTESQPIGRLVEQFLSTAFIAHPYQQPVVGWASDLNSFSAKDALEFYRKYYVPANMTVAVVGDVKAAEALPIIEKYFGRLPKAPEPLPLATREPPQRAERIVILKEQAQPFYLEGYHRPAVTHPDDAIYDAISDLMSNGRTSRLYRALVRDKQIAAFAAGFNGFPGQKYPHLFSFFAVPTPGKTPQEMREAIHAEIERMKTEDVTDAELQMVKTRAKASLVRGLADNSGLAQQLGWAQARYGDWRELFRQVERIEKVTKEDIRRIANQTFRDENRTSASIETVKSAAARKGGAQ